MIRFHFLSVLAFVSIVALVPDASAAPPQRANAATRSQSNLPKSQPKSAAMKVAKVDPARTSEVSQSATRIDELVLANYRKHGVTPNPPTNDEQFVRRIYLDITGTIPTLAQVRSFLDDNSPNKRAELIDSLLNSSGYASHMYNYWANILRLTDQPDPNVFALAYNEWVKQSIRDNMPYDEFVRTMLTAEGKVWQNPPAGYMLRDAGMPLDSLNNTVRIFLGTQIGCAQCHDHPFDHWTQKQFYELAAYTYGVKTRLTGRDEGMQPNPQLRVREELAKIDSKLNPGRALRLVRANTYVVQDNPGLRLRFPHDYQYSDAKPEEIVTPKVIFGDEPTMKKGDSPRKAFADWLTSNDNPRFTLTIANRLWKKAFGVGQIEPVDDLHEESKAENPELMDFLVAEMKRLDFDTKEYLRIIYNTKTYQRQSSIEEVAADTVYHFPGPVLRRMTAEQVWDSFLTLAIYNPDSNLRPNTDQIADVLKIDLQKTPAPAIQAKMDQYDQLFGNKAQVQMRREGYRGQILARASELPQPLPANHLLRQFGQGDRELIEGASTEGTVPQILTMFNGAVTHMMLEKGSVIYDNVMNEDTLIDRIDAIFLSILARHPTSPDRQTAMREMQRGGATGYGDVIWALVNTREFLFIQ